MALRMFTGEFLLHGTRIIGELARLSTIICSSSFSSGILPPAVCRSCWTWTLRSILQLFTSSCAILRIRSALGTVRPGHLTSTSRSLTGLTRATTSAYEISPVLDSVLVDATVSPDCRANLLLFLLPASSSRGRLRPSMTSLAMPAQVSVRPTSQSQRSPRLATPMYPKPRFLVLSWVYGLSPVISRHMYQTVPMSTNGSVGDRR
mmetsp:Transcript_48489/g.140462  ORF Transcript_48489/g.140462 Transcript_48489/m.140462 type:complete len:205 (-) Transcript_48489:303-917(-)